MRERGREREGEGGGCRGGKELCQSGRGYSLRLHCCSCPTHCPAHLVCPMRWALAAACRSFCGLKSLSTNSTVSAPTRLSPTPPVVGWVGGVCRGKNTPACCKELMDRCDASVRTCPRAEEKDKCALILLKVLQCNEALLSPH